MWGRTVYKVLVAGVWGGGGGRKYKNQLSSSLYVLSHLCISHSSSPSELPPHEEHHLPSQRRDRNQRRGASSSGPVAKNPPANATGDVGSTPGRN